MHSCILCLRKQKVFLVSTYASASVYLVCLSHPITSLRHFTEHRQLPRVNFQAPHLRKERGYVKAMRSVSFLLLMMRIEQVYFLPIPFPGHYHHDTSTTSSCSQPYHNIAKAKPIRTRPKNFTMPPISSKYSISLKTQLTTRLYKRC